MRAHLHYCQCIDFVLRQAPVNGDCFPYQSGNVCISFQTLSPAAVPWWVDFATITRLTAPKFELYRDGCSLAQHQQAE
jgi:hypothetical protein